MNAHTQPQPTTQVATADKPLRQVQNVQELINNKAAMGQLQRVAASHMNPERMMRVVANAMRTTPALSKAEPMSMLGALMTCATLGLEPNTPLGHAYLIPFKNNRKGITEVQLIVGYKGLADMAWRSGRVTYLHADVVYSDDELFEHEYGTSAELRHKPGPQQGTKTHAYAVAKIALENGREGHVHCVMPWAAVMRIRDASQGWKTAVKYNKTDSTPWGAHEDRMAAKTALRALANRGELPMSIEFAEAETVDDAPTDFASFAANPDGGHVIEGTLAEEDPDESMVDNDDEAEKPKAEEKPPAKKAKPKAESEPDADDKKPEPKKKAEAEPESESKPKSGVDYMKVADDFTDDLLDAGNPETVFELYQSQIEAAEEADPKAHKRMMVQLEAARNAAMKRANDDE